MKRKEKEKKEAEMQIYTNALYEQIQSDYDQKLAQENCCKYWRIKIICNRYTVNVPVYKIRVSFRLAQ